MARLVIGTSKAKTVPAVVRDMSPRYYRSFVLDNTGTLIPDPTQPLIDFSGIVNFGDWASYMYNNNTVISGMINMPDTINTGSSRYMFSNCPNITGANLSSVTQGYGSNAMSYMFRNSGIQSLDLSSFLSDSSGSLMAHICEGCSSLVSVKLTSLNGFTAYGQLDAAFKDCTSLPTMAFESLKMSGSNTFRNAFSGCTSLQTLWFYVLNSVGNANSFDNMLTGVTGCTVHFPKALQSTIESWTSVTNGFGGTNTTVLFDLVTSLVGADTNTYTRSEKDSTATATAWKYNDTLYYTSGVSNHTAGVHEPTVGTTIYSDSACTTAVTTVTAIA